MTVETTKDKNSLSMIRTAHYPHPSYVIPLY